MSQVVQAKCPHCQNVLRIPADWVYQPMRCKHCQKIFQAKQKPAPMPPASTAPPAKTPMPARVPPAAIAPRVPAAPPPVARPPVAVPVAAKAVKVARAAAPKNGSPLGFKDQANGIPSKPSPRGRGSWWKGAVLAVGVLGSAGILAAVVGPKIASQFNRSTPAPKDEAKPVAELKITTLPVLPNDDGPPRPPREKHQKPPDNPPPNIDIKPPPKIDVKPPPKIDIKPPKKDPPNNKKPPVGADEKFPRRALFVSVNDYLFANPLHFGTGPVAQPRGKQKAFPGSSTWAVRDAFSRMPLRFPASQLVHLSDSGVGPHAPLKSVIERTITDFLNGSRAQDRIVLLFAGHVTEDDKDAFLVPLEGKMEDPKTLIALTWLYDRLKECKAREKLLILDVCRFDPVRGNERPGGDAMGKLLDTKLQTPPAGVQVLSSCVLEQQSNEFDNGSAFLQALCAAQQDLRLKGAQEPGSPIPAEDLKDLVNSHLTSILAPHKLKQTARLTGKEQEGGAPPNPEESLPPVVAIQPPPPPGGNAASVVQVKGILDEINLTPPTRISRSGNKDSHLAVSQLPAFPAKVLDAYKADYDSFTDLLLDVDRYPLRAAVIKAAKALREAKDKFTMRESLFADANNQLKTQIRNEQAAPGKAELFLKDALADLKEAGKKRDEEKSKRWQAHYDYVLARLLARLVYVTEYNFALAQIRTDTLPEKTDGANGFRLGASKKVNVTEGFAKDWAKEMRKTWEKIINQYPETPWAVVAERERLTVLGLEWRPARQ